VVGSRIFSYQGVELLVLYLFNYNYKTSFIHKNASTRLNDHYPKQVFIDQFGRVVAVTSHLGATFLCICFYER
jgi:hypothetical protein